MCQVAQHPPPKKKKPRDYGDSVGFPGESEVGSHRPEEDLGGSEGGLS